MAHPKIIDPVLSAEFSRFESALEIYLRKVEGETGALVRKQGRLFGVDLVAKTNPFGLNQKAAIKGEKTASSDVSKVFASQGAVYAEIQDQSQEAADDFYYYIKSGDFVKAKKIIDKLGGPFVGMNVIPVSESEHQAQRTNGRVRRNHPVGVVSNNLDLVNYRIEIKNRVMWAKASWAVDLGKLGGLRGIPSFINKHKNSPGRIEDFTIGSNPKKQINFISQVPYIRYLLSESSVRRALDFRAKSMMKELGFIATKNFKKRF